MEGNAIKLTSPEGSVHEELINLLSNRNDDIEILQIDSHEFDIYDVSLLNEFNFPHVVKELELLHVSTKRGISPVISQISVAYNIERLVLNCAVTAAALRAFVTPQLRSLALIGEDVDFRMLEALRGGEIKDLDFSQSGLISIAALLKAVPSCESIVLERATLLETLMMAARCESVSVRAGTMGETNAAEALCSSIMTRVDEDLRAGGSTAFSTSQRLCRENGMSLADYALIGSNLSEFIDEYELSTKNGPITFVFCLEEQFYQQCKAMASGTGNARLRRLSVLPGGNPADYWKMITNLGNYVNFRALEEFGVGIADEEMKNWVSANAQEIHFTVRPDDQKWKIEQPLKIASRDEFFREQREEYVVRARNAFQ